MRNDYTIYIIVCFLSILFSLINRVYPIGGKEYLLNNVMYFSTWGTLFFIEIRKVLIIKGNKKEQSVDYFPIIITILMMIVCVGIEQARSMTAATMGSTILPSK